MPDEEIVDEVDTDDRVVGKQILQECYLKGMLHRAVAIFLWNREKQVYLQRRSLSDDWYPGYWTASCTGHVKSGEDHIQAAVREIKEELGITAQGSKLLFRLLVPPIHYGQLTEYEMMYVLESYYSGDRVHPNPLEVEEGRFLSMRDLKEFFRNNKAQITPDALIYFDKYIKMKEL